MGTKKPTIFGVMDLTQGYHQAPLTFATRAFTVFITFHGVYQFTRLPFGLKQASSYFQEMMATIVLTGLIYHNVRCILMIALCMEIQTENLFHVYVQFLNDSDHT